MPGGEKQSATRRKARGERQVQLQHESLWEQAVRGSRRAAAPHTHRHRSAADARSAACSAGNTASRCPGSANLTHQPARRKEQEGRHVSRWGGGGKYARRRGEARQGRGHRTQQPKSAPMQRAPHTGTTGWPSQPTRGHRPKSSAWYLRS